jgi:hypothetical protein
MIADLIKGNFEIKGICFFFREIGDEIDDQGILYAKDSIGI